MAAAGMNSFFQFMTVFMFLLGGGKGDLLDYVSTESYWKAKSVEVSPEAMLQELAPRGGEAPNLKRQIEDLGSEFPRVREAAAAEIAAAGLGAVDQLKEIAQSPNAVQAEEARKLIEKITTGKAQDIRRLMAIRTLGEMHYADALPTLEKLTTSKDVFVATYARRSLAAIQGKPAPAEDMKAKFESDVAVLPDGLGIVAQYRPGLLEHMPLAELNRIDAPQINEPARIGPLKGQASDRMEDKLIELAEYFGNARLDGVTLAMASTANPNGSFVHIIFRGQYDPALLKPLLTGLGGATPLAESRIGDVQVFRHLHRPKGFLVHGTNRVVLYGGSRGTDQRVDDLIAALQAGKGKISESKEMSALIQAADKTGPIWGVAKGEGYRMLFPTGILDGVETGTLTSAIKDGKVMLTLQATCTDAEKAKAATAAFDAQWQAFIAMLSQQSPMMPAIGPFLDVVKSVESKQDAGKITLTGELPNLQPGRLILPPFLMFTEMRGGMMR